MIIGVVKETYPGERRVALIPDTVARLKKKGMEVLVHGGAGLQAGLTDAMYHDKGAEVTADRDDVFARADVIAQVRLLGSNLQAGRDDLERLRSDQVLIGFCDPLGQPQAVQDLAARGARALAMELVPRITRAQSMDALSSMATVAGYRAVLVAAVQLPKMFPMMMTAAGTITPAKVLIIGAGVAGLQAIASARRLGAVVSAYDIRPAVKEQIESLGAKFLEMELDAGEAEDKGGYAREMDEEFYRRQREFMTRAVADSDVVITTAAVPGKKAPILITTPMVEGMQPGSVVVDLAAATGGNCEPTKPDETVKLGEVTIIGPTNLPAEVPFHASQMYARNVATLLDLLVDEGQVKLDMGDEIIRDTLLTRGGEVVHPRIRELLGLSPLESEEGAAANE